MVASGPEPGFPPRMTSSLLIRPAVPADAPTIARHRAGMFRDMGELPPALEPRLLELTLDYLRHAMPAGEYHGWLATPPDHPETVIAGAGVQLRRVLPFPRRTAVAIREGRQGIVLNVYTEREWRRRGAARALMEAVIAWAGREQLDSLVLHAAPDGRPLYEELGFVPTNEMRFEGEW